MRFTYRVVDNEKIREFESHLNELGEQGFRIVGFTATGIASGTHRYTAVVEKSEENNQKTSINPSD